MADASNIDDVAAWEKDLIDSWNFTRPGQDQSLGRDMARDVAVGIQERTVAEQRDAMGGSLKPNEKRYKTWKEVKLGVYQPLVKTGQMLSLESLVGDVTVAPDEIVMNYGTGRSPTRSASPMGGLSKQDEKVTDRQKADWNSDDRPFYAMDDQIIATLADRAAAEFDKIAREKS
jgi:hypothetical protein